MFNMVHNGKRKTPMLACIAECIHDTCKSKKLMKMLNRLSLCNSYGDVRSIDIGLPKRLISITGDNSVPVEPSISSKVILHGVMDNWDHQEHTVHKTTGSHDMVFILVQDNTVETKVPRNEISVRKHKDNSSSKCLETILPCQKIIKM